MGGKLRRSTNSGRENTDLAKVAPDELPVVVLVSSKHCLRKSKTKADLNYAYLIKMNWFLFVFQL